MFIDLSIDYHFDFLFQSFKNLGFQCVFSNNQFFQTADSKKIMGVINNRSAEIQFLDFGISDAAYTGYSGVFEV